MVSLTCGLTLEQQVASLQLELITSKSPFNELSKDWHTNRLFIYMSHKYSAIHMYTFC